MMEREYITHSAEETEALGRALGEELIASDRTSAFVALYGDLGVGKTAFTRGLAAAVGYTKPVKSPTYTILNEYRGGSRDVFHFDLYRIEDEDDLWSIGFWDCVDSLGIVVCEWSERIPGVIPEDAVSVRIARRECDGERSVSFENL